MTSFGNMDDLAETLLCLLPEYYNDFKNVLEGYRIEQIMVLYQLRKNGGQLERPTLSTELGLDSKQMFYIINPLREKGFICTERISRIAIDKITDTGNIEFIKIKRKLYSLIKKVTIQIL